MALTTLMKRAMMWPRLIASPTRTAMTKDALLGDHQRRAQRGLVRAESEHHGDVEAGLEAAVAADEHLLAQAVDDERLMRLGQSALESRAGVLDAARRRGARAALHAADVDDIGAGLGDPDRDGADVRHAGDLHADPG